MVREVMHYILQFLIWLIIIGAIFTWIPPHNRPRFADKIIAITDDLLEPIRKIIPPIGNIDISPLVAIILLQILDNFIRRGY